MEKNKVQGTRGIDIINKRHSGIQTASYCQKFFFFLRSSHSTFKTGVHYKNLQLKLCVLQY